MVEDTKFKIWNVVQSVIASLLVFAVISLSSTLGELNNSIIKHEILIGQLEEFRRAGGRFTEADGEALKEKLSFMNNNQVRMWKAIREHISEGQHQGADYRLKRLEEHVTEEQNRTP